MRVVGLCSVLGFWAGSALSARAQPVYRTVALTGETAPGGGAGAVYSGFFTPVLNGAGRAAFKGIVTGPGVDSTNDLGIWSEGAGSLGLVAREGDAAPGAGAGAVYSSFSFTHPVLNGAGQTAFWGGLTGAGVDLTNNSGIWVGGAGSLELVVRSGDAAPSTGVVFRDLFFSVLNDAGQIAFRGEITGAGVDLTNNSGIWVGGAGSLGLVARTGDAAPGAGAGVVYSGLNSLVLNGAGQTAFVGGLTGAGVDFTNDLGIWAGGVGSLGLVARRGDAAPGAGAGVVYRDLFFPVLNGAGQTAFRGTLSGAGVDSTNNLGIWSGGGGSLGLVAREGSPAPGTGAVFGSFLLTPVLNGAGQIAFGGTLTGAGVNATNAEGIWSQGTGSLGLVARTGDAVPGADVGVLFWRFGLPSLNGAGQIAFDGYLTGAGVNSTNDSGIWMTDPNGFLTLILREGDLFDVNDDPLIDDLRTVGSLSLQNVSGGEDGRANSFNDAGQLAISLFFTDGTSGVFVATIPEPASLTLLGLGVLGLATRRRYGIQ